MKKAQLPPQEREYVLRYRRAQCALTHHRKRAGAMIILSSILWFGQQWALPLLPWPDSANMGYLLFVAILLMNVAVFIATMVCVLRIHSPWRETRSIKAHFQKQGIDLANPDLAGMP